MFLMYFLDHAGLTGAARGSFLHSITHLTMTDIRTLGVLTLPKHTDVAVEFTLIHICKHQTKVSHQHTLFTKRFKTDPIQTDGYIWLDMHHILVTFKT